MINEPLLYLFLSIYSELCQVACSKNNKLSITSSSFCVMDLGSNENNQEKERENETSALQTKQQKAEQTGAVPVTVSSEFFVRFIHRISSVFPPLSSWASIIQSVKIINCLQNISIFFQATIFQRIHADTGLGVTRLGFSFSILQNGSSFSCARLFFCEVVSIPDT